MNTPKQTKPTQIWNPWDVKPGFKDEAQQTHLKAWLARAVDLAQRVSVAYSLSPKQFAIGAPIAAPLLVRLGVLVLRNSPDVRDLIRPFRFTQAEPAFADGVALGRYAEGSILRTVVLASRDDFAEPPTASDPSVAERIFRDGLDPAPARGLTLGRLAAVHLGLCRLLARAAEHIEMPLSFGVPASGHPLLGQTRALSRKAREHGAASDTDWNTAKPAPVTLVEFTMSSPPRKQKVYKRCHLCRKPLGSDVQLHKYTERVTRAKSGREREVYVERIRAFHQPCLAKFVEGSRL